MHQVFRISEWQKKLEMWNDETMVKVLSCNDAYNPTDTLQKKRMNFLIFIICFILYFFISFFFNDKFYVQYQENMTKLLWLLIQQ